MRVKVYRNERNFNKLFIIVIFIGAHTVVCASNDPRPRLPENDYVLRSCMSSVELSRHKIDVSNSKLPNNAPQHSRDRTASLPVTQSSLSFNRMKSSVKQARGKSRTKLDQRYSFGGHYTASKIIADTPLATLNHERRGRKDGPQLFVMNDIMPEVKSTVPDEGKNKKEASIIVIESG